MSGITKKQNGLESLSRPVRCARSLCVNVQLENRTNTWNVKRDNIPLSLTGSIRANNPVGKLHPPILFVRWSEWVTCIAFRCMRTFIRIHSRCAQQRDMNVCHKLTISFDDVWKLVYFENGTTAAACIEMIHSTNWIFALFSPSPTSKLHFSHYSLVKASQSSCSWLNVLHFIKRSRQTATSFGCSCPNLLTAADFIFEMNLCVAFQQKVLSVKNKYPALSSSRIFTRTK